MARAKHAWSKHPAFADELTRGERAADAVRNRMGSWGFVTGFVALMVLWAVANSIFLLGGTATKRGFDPYPYILLNLFLSMLAGLQGAILLIAAKRQDAISSKLALHDDELLRENTELTKEIHLNTKMIQAIANHLGAN